MFKVNHNGNLRATFAKRQDADNFVDMLCGDAEDDEIVLLSHDDMEVYGFDDRGQYWESRDGKRVYSK